MYATTLVTLMAVTLAVTAFLVPRSCGEETSPSRDSREERRPIDLPQPRFQSDTSVEAALRARRSVREFVASASLSMSELGQLLWAAQGMTREPDRRTAPSAGALYPFECYVVVGAVEDLPAGVYRYQPAGHRLEWIDSGDRRRDLATAALDQQWIADAPVVIVLAGIYGRTTGRYGERGHRYVHIEAGHVGQNIALQAVALNLGTTMVGAFTDDQVARLLSWPRDRAALYIIPVGPPAESP